MFNCGELVLHRPGSPSEALTFQKSLLILVAVEFRVVTLHGVQGIELIAEILSSLSPSFLENTYFLGYGMVAEIIQGVL